MAPQKTITFPFLQNTGSYKKNRFVATPLFTQKLVFFQLGFLKPKNNDVQQKHNFKSATKNKDKKKGFKEKRRQETKKEKILMKENFVIEYSDVVLFMKQKQRRKKRKERDKTRKQKKAKKKDRKERKKEKKKRETEKEKLKKGEPQKS